MTMEGEINNFIMVWTVAVASLCYCYYIGKIAPQGTIRLLFILPVIALFLILPLNLYSINLGGPSYFFLSWVATFKLILFAFGSGPLSTNPPISLSHFIPVACFPIKIQQRNSVPGKEKSETQSQVSADNQKNPSLPINRKNHKSPLNYATKMLILTTCAPVYENKNQIHPKMLLLFYSIYLYILLENLLAMVGKPTSALLGVELEPQFDEPYLATSLQDFWGRRWNIMVSSILRPTVYDPILRICRRRLGKEWARLPAIMASFFVSGMMHELIFYYIGRQRPTWDLTCFFLVNGFGLAMETALKKAFKGKWKLPQLVSRLLAILFVLSTGLWLFLPSLVRCGVDSKARTEFDAFVEFVKETYEVLRYSFVRRSGK